MAIIVEDGTGLATAQTYVSAAEADAYFSAREVDAWTGSIAVKESAILVATEYMEATYTWIGRITRDAQALGWPREYLYDKDGRSLSNTVPTAVKRASFELALKAITSTLLLDTTRDDYVVREKIDVLETEYRAGAPTRVEYNFVSRILKDLITQYSGGSSVTLLRA